MTNFCINCKWSRQADTYYCHNPELLETDLVIGNQNPRMCAYQRLSGSKCGPAGTKFAPIILGEAPLRADDPRKTKTGPASQV